MSHQLIPIGQRFIKVKTGIDKDDWRRGRNVRNQMEQYGTLGAKARDHPNLTEGFVCANTQDKNPRVSRAANA